MLVLLRDLVVIDKWSYWAGAMTLLIREE